MRVPRRVRHKLKEAAFWGAFIWGGMNTLAYVGVSTDLWDEQDRCSQASSYEQMYPRLEDRLVLGISTRALAPGPWAATNIYQAMRCPETDTFNPYNY